VLALQWLRYLKRYLSITISVSNLQIDEGFPEEIISIGSLIKSIRIVKLDNFLVHFMRGIVLLIASKRFAASSIDFFLLNPNCWC